MAGNRIKGITIEIDGNTSKLDQALKGTNDSLKSVQSKLKDVERLLKMDPGNVVLLDQKQRLLAKSTELTADKLKTLNKVVEESTVSDEKYEQWEKAFASIQRQITATTNSISELEKEKKKLEDSGLAPDSAPIIEAEEKIERLNKKMADLQQQATNTYEELGRPISTEYLDAVQREIIATEQAADGANEKMGGLSGFFSGAADKLGLMDIAAGGAAFAIGQKLVEAAMAAVDWIWSLDEATEEYREAMGKLNTAFEAAGYGPEAAKEAYEGFYKILGETDTATEASQLLAQLTDSEEDLAKWIEIAAGVYGTFGDSLPIEGLIEAANETAKTGKVTGVLADALNWVGMSEDEFNEALSQTADVGDRARLIMNNLGLAYEDAADSFYKNNEALIETREVQMQLDETQAALGESVASLKNKFFELFGPALIEGMKLAEVALEGVAWVIDKIGQALDWLGQKIKDVIGFFQELFGASKQASNVSVGGAGTNSRALAEPYALRAASAENLPYLAQGTVTRPNSPFMAVIGDNPKEPEIVSPLSTIEQAVRNVMGEGGGQASNIRVTVNFTGSAAQLVRMLQPQIVAETNRLGPQYIT